MSDDAARRTEASLLTDRLRDEIVRGDVVPGSKLKLVPLARRFAVSRGPLREAASRLAAEGLVTIEDQRGFRVSSVSRADLADLTRTRQRVEELALRDSMAAGDLAWEGRVMATCHVLARVTPARGEAPRAPFLLHHRAFHEALVSACPSTYLLDFRSRLYALTERYRNLAARRYRTGPGRDIAAEHLQLAQAVVARDTERACDLLRAHLEETAQTLLDDWPGDPGGEDE
jgi:GntR family carbon starvation induced transcriptional regulator